MALRLQFSIPNCILSSSGTVRQSASAKQTDDVCVGNHRVTAVGGGLQNHQVQPHVRATLAGCCLCVQEGSMCCSAVCCTEGPGASPLGPQSTSAVQFCWISCKSLQKLNYPQVNARESDLDTLQFSSTKENLCHALLGECAR